MPPQLMLKPLAIKVFLAKTRSYFLRIRSFRSFKNVNEPKPSNLRSSSKGVCFSLGDLLAREDVLLNPSSGFGNPWEIFLVNQV